MLTQTQSGNLMRVADAVSSVHLESQSSSRTNPARPSRFRQIGSESDLEKVVGGGSQSYPKSAKKVSNSKMERVAENAVVGNTPNSGTALDNKPRFNIPILFVLIAECVFIAAVFIALVAYVVIEMEDVTKKLVEDRISGDLRYSQSQILIPIQSAAEGLMAHRLRYIALSREVGYSICNEYDDSLAASRLFFRDALSTVHTHYPLIGFVYAMHLSDRWRHRTTGDQLVSQCSTSIDYRFTDVNGTQRYSTEVATVDQAQDGFIGFNTTTDSVTDFRYEGYVVEGMAHTDFGWWPYLWLEPGSGRAVLFIGGFAPMKINQTLPNGTEISFQPDLTVPKAIKKDPSLKVVGTIAMDLMMSRVDDLISSINPPTSGAHTTLYDLKTMQMLATTLDTPMMHGASMFTAGATLSPEANEAFHAMNPAAGIPGDTTVRVVYDNGRIISCIHMTTTSAIDFVIIQSTPVSYYLNRVTTLRNVMIIFGVLAAVAVVVVCMAVVFNLRMKLAEIQEGMHLAAVLKNDKVQPIRSVMTELDDLCVTFAQMNAKLGAARAFMPQSMLTSDSNSDSDDEGDPKGDKGASRPIVSVRDGVSESSKTTFSVDPRKDDSTMFTLAQGTKVTKDASSGAGTLSTLITKRVTVLSINTRGFHRRAVDGVAVSSMSHDITSAVQAICGQKRGVIDSFHGDHYVLSFNAAKHNARGPQQAVQCALDLAATFNSTTSKLGAFTMGASCGKAMVGHLGSSDMKRFSIVGKVYSRALALERVCKDRTDDAAVRKAPIILNDIMVDAKLASSSSPQHRFSPASPAQLNTQLVCDDSTMGSLEQFFYAQVIGIAFDRVNPNSSRQTTDRNGAILYSILDSIGAQSGETDEWLYEMRNESNAMYDKSLPDLNKAMIELLSNVQPLPTNPNILSPQPSSEAMAKFKDNVASIEKAVLTVIQNAQSAASSPLPTSKSSQERRGTGEGIMPLGHHWGQIALEDARDLINASDALAQIPFPKLGFII